MVISECVKCGVYELNSYAKAYKGMLMARIRGMDVNNNFDPQKPCPPNQAR